MVEWTKLFSLTADKDESELVGIECTDEDLEWLDQQTTKYKFEENDRLKQIVDQLRSESDLLIARLEKARGIDGE